jgi:hypothetical protein
MAGECRQLSADADQTSPHRPTNRTNGGVGDRRPATGAMTTPVTSPASTEYAVTCVDTAEIGSRTELIRTTDVGRGRLWIAALIFGLVAGTAGP